MKFRIGSRDNRPVPFSTDSDGFLLVPTDVVLYLQEDDGSPPVGQPACGEYLSVAIRCPRGKAGIVIEPFVAGC